EEPHNLHNKDTVVENLAEFEKKELVLNMRTVLTKLASAMRKKEFVQRISTLITTMMVNEWVHTWQVM
nr:hypothetical protein [Tanacetum cinerariifolium]